MSQPIAIATPTVMDGTVIRWYEDTEAAADHAELCSASREGVLVRVFLHAVPEGVLTAANAAYEALRTGRDLPPGLVTHRRDGFGWRAQIVPVVQGASA